ncbi:MAG: hypothetical protein HWE21_09420 [Cytophagia bacterium]|nr:hypothetical protein [Cytophagia bacterium]
MERFFGKLRMKKEMLPAKIDVLTNSTSNKLGKDIKTSGYFPLTNFCHSMHTC